MPNKTHRALPRYKISDFFRSLLKVSAISFCRIPPVDIFRVVERGQHIWIEPSETVKEALMRVQSLGMGEYLITNQRTGFRLSPTVDVSAVTGSLGSDSPHLV
jgi:hypothetical protein